MPLNILQFKFIDIIPSTIDRDKETLGKQLPLLTTKMAAMGSMGGFLNCASSFIVLLFIRPTWSKQEGLAMIYNVGSLGIQTLQKPSPQLAQ